MAVDVFSVPIFLVVFRETIEAGIIVSILLAFLKQMRQNGSLEAPAYKSLLKQVWVGAILGFLLCLVVGGAIIGIFYRFSRNLWNSAEYIYQGVFYLLAALIITVVGVAFLRIGKMQEKWRVKISAALEKDSPSTKRSAMGYFKKYSRGYAVFILSFITVAREGIEGVVFVSGVTFSASASSVPLPVVVGLIAGIAVGWIMYRGASLARIRYFLVASSCLLYLVAAGLVARSVWYFEQGHWSSLVGKDVGESGAGPGSYDIDRSVWHVNCCSPEFNGGYGWGVFNGILGWTNSATYSTVIAYNVYWILVSLFFIALRHREIKGKWPLIPKRGSSQTDAGVLRN